MEVIKLLKKELITYYSKDNEHLHQQHFINKFLQTFSSLLLSEVFVSNFERAKYNLLKANAVYVSFISTYNNEIKWVFVFVFSSTPRINYSEDYIPSFDFIKHMIAIEHDGDEVLYGIEIGNENLLPIINVEYLQSKIKEYSQSRK